MYTKLPTPNWLVIINWRGATLVRSNIVILDQSAKSARRDREIKWSSNTSQWTNGYFRRCYFIPRHPVSDQYRVPVRRVPLLGGAQAENFGQWEPLKCSVILVRRYLHAGTGCVPHSAVVMKLDSGRVGYSVAVKLSLVLQCTSYLRIFPATRHWPTAEKNKKEAAARKWQGLQWYHCFPTDWCTIIRRR